MNYAINKALICLALWGGALFTAALRAESDSAVAQLKKRISDSFGSSWIENKAKVPIKPEERRSLPLPYWLPMCFFFDASVDPKIANEKMKLMVKEYSNCGIILETYSYTLKPGYSKIPKDLVAGLLASCPFPSAYGIRGAIQVEANEPDLPAQMCHEKNAKGCSTLCYATSVSLITKDAGYEVGMHESLHNNCCGPTCVDSGKGDGISVGHQIELTGKPIINAKIAKAIKASPTLSTNACASLIAGATENDLSHLYYVDKEDYYVPEKDPSKQVDTEVPRNLLPPLNPGIAIAPNSLPGGNGTGINFRRDSVNTKVEWLLGEDISAQKPDISSISELTQWNSSIEANLITNVEGSNEGEIKTFDRENPMEKIVIQPKPDPVSESRMIETPRKRGAGLRKAKDIRRKTKGVSVGVINAYESSGSNSGGVELDPAD